MTIAPDERERIKELFSAVLGLSIAERAAFLKGKCSDPAVCAEVERLVSLSKQTGGFLSQPVYDPSQSTISGELRELFSNGDVLGGRFRVVRFIAAGGMGEVYEAEDLELHERVAIKTIHPEMLQHQQAVARFKREVQLARKVTHPNVCRIYDLFRHVKHGDETSDGIVFVSMELLKGRTLADQIRETRRFSLTQALPLVKQLASALSAAHLAGVVHRDFKPSNVVLVPSDAKAGAEVRAVITDFGLAFQTENSGTTSTTTGLGVFGTPAYMAPEQLAGNIATPATDIYALGLVIYEMVTGVRPFEGVGGNLVGELAKRLGGPPPSPREFAPELSSAWEGTILKCLEHDPSNRFADANSVYFALAALVENSRVVDRSHNPAPNEARSIGVQARELVLLYRRNTAPDDQLASILEVQLKALGFNVFVDRHLVVGMEWAHEIEQRICNADAVIVLVSAASINSEMLAYEIQIAHDASQKGKGTPRILPIRVDFEGALPDAFGRILNQIQYASWKKGTDTDALLAQVRISLLQPPKPRPSVKLEAIGGAVPLESAYYILRPTDEEFRTAVVRNDSIVLVKGARQMGKTSLLARGLNGARAAGCKVILTDFQQLNASQLETVESLLWALGETIADELDLDVNFDEVLNPSRGGPSMNFARFLRREVLEKLAGRLVWGMDEVDRLFTCTFGSEVFGLFRSWHNARALDPSAPWHKLTLALAYATEAHMFITDINQSPFNVGTRLSLADFTLEQVSELNRRYGSPLQDVPTLNQFYDLLGGQPYLTRRGLHELAARQWTFFEFMSQATRDEGPFGDHLRRILFSLAQDPVLCDVVRKLLGGRPSTTPETFYRLRSAGIASGDSAREMRPRCRLYEAYLAQHLL